MKIKSSFPTKFKAGQYLKDRGWVLTNVTADFHSIYTHPTLNHKNVIHRVKGQWYITSF